MAIIRANYLAQGPKTATAAKRAVRYYTYREGPDLSARHWYDADGQAVSYEAVQAAVAEHAASYAYTYRLVVSTKDADLGVDGYRQVLARHFDRYYLITHHNTPYPHAHVLGFREQRAQKNELTALRTRALKLEQHIARTLKQQVSQALDSEPARHLTRARGLHGGG
jgi:hypothetical protein